MLKLLKLTARNFRSWVALDYTFPDGLTLLTGENGAGKTSLRFATQFALTGAIPGLKKSELRRRGDDAKRMLARLECEIDDVHTVISRSMTKTEITQNGETFGVRDASFLDKLKLATNFAFLSAEQAQFVDVQEYKRKEMLNSLIPEVNFLRKKCTPRAKEMLVHLHDKQVKVGSDIDNVYILLDELEEARVSAQDLVNSEVGRIKALEAQMEKGLPMSRGEYRDAKAQIVEFKKQYTDLTGKADECKTWVNRALKHNQRVSTFSTEISKIKGNLSRIAAEIEGYEGRLDDAKKLQLCPKCMGRVVCEDCGEPVVIADRTADFEKKLENLRDEQSMFQQRLDQKMEEAGRKHAIVSDEEVEKIENRAGRFSAKAEEIHKMAQDINAAVREYEIANARAEEISKVTMHKEHLEALKKNVKKIESRIAAAKDTIKRKTKTVDVIEQNILNFGVAVKVMYEKMPSVYYSLFLTRLSEFCQFLMSEISNMKISLGATEDGISIIVDGKEVKQLSSGEKQRVRIATTLAFALMAPKTDTLFIDEVFDSALDTQGVNELAQLLSGHIRAYFPKIIMVSHRQDIAMSVGADQVIEITKGADDCSKLKEIKYNG